MGGTKPGMYWFRRSNAATTTRRGGILHSTLHLRANCLLAVVAWTFRAIACAISDIDDVVDDNNGDVFFRSRHCDPPPKGIK